MPGPFPGMDPYLEDPTVWPGVHQAFITYAMETLNATLPPVYVADIGERVYVVPREVFIEILAVPGERRVVTVLEILSPSNKTARGPGRPLYLTKQRHVLQSEVHLVEVDLLRSGEHTVAVPREALLERERWDYLVNLHRGGQLGQYEAWTISLRQRLPRILVPLSEGDPDLVLDLQAIFDRCYEAGGYARRIDYRLEPSPALTGADAAWADELLREKGRRSST